jgi:hypothetical protein
MHSFHTTGNSTMSCGDENSAAWSAVAKGNLQQVIPYTRCSHIIQHKKYFFVFDGASKSLY